jgi:hypothetical protein
MDYWDDWRQREQWAYDMRAADQAMERSRERMDYECLHHPRMPLERKLDHRGATKPGNSRHRASWGWEGGFYRIN